MVLALATLRDRCLTGTTEVRIVNQYLVIFKDKAQRPQLVLADEPPELESGIQWVFHYKNDSGVLVESRFGIEDVDHYAPTR